LRPFIQLALINNSGDSEDYFGGGKKEATCRLASEEGWNLTHLKAMQMEGGGKKRKRKPRRPGCVYY